MSIFVRSEWNSDWPRNARFTLFTCSAVVGGNPFDSNSLSKQRDKTQKGRVQDEAFWTGPQTIVRQKSLAVANKIVGSHSTGSPWRPALSTWLAMHRQDQHDNYKNIIAQNSHHIERFVVIIIVVTLAVLACNYSLTSQEVRNSLATKTWYFILLVLKTWQRQSKELVVNCNTNRPYSIG